MYWRSLGELADTLRVPRVPAPGIPRAGVRVERPEGPPPVPEADERVARARRGRRVHETAGRRDRSLRQAARRSRPRPSAVFRQRDPAFRHRAARSWSRATWGVRPKSKATPSIRPVSAPPTRSRRRPSSTSTIRIAPRRSPTAVRSAVGRVSRRHAGGGLAPEGAAGSGAPVPDRTDHVPVARRADGDGPRRLPAGASGISTIPITRDGARMARRRPPGATRSTTSTRPTWSSSLDADFLTCGPGSVRYQKDFAARRRVTDERKEMNRLYAIESTPSLTGAKADHRLALKAGEIEGFARQLAASVGSGHRAAPGPESRRPDPDRRRRGEVGRRRSPRIFRRTAARSLVVAGDYQPAAVHALAHAMNQALGNVGATVTYGAAIEASPADQRGVAQRSRPRDGRGTGRAARHPWRQSRSTPRPPI